MQTAYCKLVIANLQLKTYYLQLNLGVPQSRFIESYRSGKGSGFSLQSFGSCLTKSISAAILHASMMPQSSIKYQDMMLRLIELS